MAAKLIRYSTMDEKTGKAIPTSMFLKDDKLLAKKLGRAVGNSITLGEPFEYHNGNSTDRGFSTYDVTTPEGRTAAGVGFGPGQYLGAYENSVIFEPEAMVNKPVILEVEPDPYDEDALIDANSKGNGDPGERGVRKGLAYKHPMSDRLISEIEKFRGYKPSILRQIASFLKKEDSDVADLEKLGVSDDIIQKVKGYKQGKRKYFSFDTYLSRAIHELAAEDTARRYEESQHVPSELPDHYSDERIKNIASRVSQRRC